ncbi:flagellar basal body-associated FliL family protein [Brucepastera parasyntrophica]|uniref:flagellar basal body-associated FliL family protein n=1 Tax=Brucepastera parasyntrophica TaxID=2880008 RepID=UPI00210E881E|nr:flagellar basal body-associated FliL family protein [Brucepastera parasyntrophica]
MRSIILDWFSRRTLAEITGMGEAKIKQELIQEINRDLVLGQVSVLYFEQFMVLD